MNTSRPRQKFGKSLRDCDRNRSAQDDLTEEDQQMKAFRQEPGTSCNKESLRYCVTDVEQRSSKCNTIDFPADHLDVFIPTPKEIREVKPALPDFGFFYLQRVGPLTLYIPVDGQNAQIPKLSEHFRGPQFKEGYRFVRRRKVQVVESPRASIQTLLDTFEPRRSLIRSSLTFQKLRIREKLGMDELNKVFFVLPIKYKGVYKGKRRLTKEGETSLVPVEWLRKFSTVNLEDRYLNQNLDEES